jgi:lipoprotein-anchoring transpeptidase ErfK/SrfK
MSAEHHPSDVTLLTFAAGTLDAQRDEIAAHIRGCASCRAFVRAMEHVGGILLEELPPTSMESGSLSEILARIEQPDLSTSAAPDSPSVSRSPSSDRRWFGRTATSARRRRLLQALPIAAAIALSVGVTYFIAGNPVSPPSGLEIVHITAEDSHPIPADTLQLQERPGYVPPDDESRALAYQRQLVFFRTAEPSGTILVDTSKDFLYLVLGDNRAMRYAIGVGRDCFQWQGFTKISHKTEWPDWTPTPEAIAEQPDLPRFMSGGAGNPLGARAIYLSDAGYHIHGTNEPEAIGHAVSSGCIRLANSDIIDFYQRVPVGARVIVEQAPVV